MKEFTSCSVKKRFEEKWVCPYCKKEIGKTIYVESGTDGTSVVVSYGHMNHRRKCRANKMMEGRKYKILDIDCCLNCESFWESCYETYEPDIECTNAREFIINPLGHCSAYKRRKD